MAFLGVIFKRLDNVLAAVGEEMARHTHVRHGKTQVWNRGGVEPSRGDSQSSQSCETDAVMWRGDPLLSRSQKGVRSPEFPSATEYVREFYETKRQQEVLFQRIPFETNFWLRGGLGGFSPDDETTAHFRQLEAHEHVGCFLSPEAIDRCRTGDSSVGGVGKHTAEPSQLEMVWQQRAPLKLEEFIHDTVQPALRDNARARPVAARPTGVCTTHNFADIQGYKNGPSTFRFFAGDFTCPCACSRNMISLATIVLRVPLLRSAVKLEHVFLHMSLCEILSPTICMGAVWW